jgi:ATP-dependent DNA ligase
MSNKMSDKNFDKKFDTLYGKDVNGKVKEWNIKVIKNEDHSLIEVLFGYQNGKMTPKLQRIDVGKNIGKKNETSHYQQALLEAQSKWKKKSESGYLVLTSKKDNVSDTKELGITTNTTNNTTTNIITFPMLANDFNKHKQKLIYPAYIQPKLDGYRMSYNSKTKFCNSRQGKEFDIVRKTDLYKELVDITENIILDGELYIHNGVFEHLGMLRKKKLSNDDIQKLNEIEYHVYDIIDSEKTYEQRYEFLLDFFSKNHFVKIKLVETKIIHSESELKIQHLNFVKNNYEGSIVRNKNGMYRCKARSSDLLKYKDFIDYEFEIIDFTSEKDNNNNNLIVWVCQTKSLLHFNVRPKGTREERIELYSKASEFIGKKLYVKFFELTEAGIPRFPTTKTDSYTTYIRNVIE